MSEHEALEIYDRLVVSSLNSISRAIDLNQQAKDPKVFLDELFHLLFEAKKNPLIELLSKKRIRVRAATLDALATLLNTINVDALAPHMEMLAKNVLPLIDEKERNIQLSLWRGCLLSILDKSPAGVVAKFDLKMIEAKTLEMLRKAAFGAGKSFYVSVPAFLSRLPHAQFSALKAAQLPPKFSVEEYVKERFSFIKKFFEAMMQGY